MTDDEKQKKAKEKRKKIRAKNDKAWKEIIGLYLKDFVEFFWPKAYEDINWKIPAISLEQQLAAIGMEKESDEKFVDKLFQVTLKNGQEQWVLLHVEVQHSNDNDFSTRMLEYFCRIFSHYKMNVASLAILAYNHKKGEIGKYHTCIWDSEITRTYKVVKLADYKLRETELLASKNPFALVVLLQLAAMETRPSDEKRLLSKLELLDGLYQYGWNKEKSINLYRFLDVILRLMPKLKVQYMKKAEKIDGRYEMRLMSDIELKGYKHGMLDGEARGEIRGETRMLMRQLRKKFRRIPRDIIAKINNANTNEIEHWADNILFADSLDEVFKK